MKIQGYPTVSIHLKNNHSMNNEGKRLKMTHILRMPWRFTATENHTKICWKITQDNVTSCYEKTDNKHNKLWLGFRENA